MKKPLWLKTLRLNQGQKKGQNGILTIIGGSKKIHGAPLYAVEAAAPFVDLIFFHSPEKNNHWIANHMKTKTNAFVTVEKRKDLDEAVAKSDCILIGPGLAETPTNKQLVNGILKKNQKKVVLDAGALILADKRLFKGRVILTPHSKEFKRCFDKAATSKNAKAAARKHRCVILLKGKIDTITDGKKTVQNGTGNAGMTRGGTGDVLAGMVAALATQNNLFLAAKAGAYLNGLAGDNVAKKVRAFTAQEVAKALPNAFELCVQR